MIFYCGGYNYKHASITRAKGKGIINFTLDGRIYTNEVGLHVVPAFTFPSRPRPGTHMGAAG